LNRNGWIAAIEYEACNVHRGCILINIVRCCEVWGAENASELKLQLDHAVYVEQAVPVVQLGSMSEAAIYRQAHARRA
jgi:hypothetical protein